MPRRERDRVGQIPKTALHPATRPDDEPNHHDVSVMAGAFRKPTGMLRAIIDCADNDITHHVQFPGESVTEKPGVLKRLGSFAINAKNFITEELLLSKDTNREQ